MCNLDFLKDMKVEGKLGGRRVNKNRIVCGANTIKEHYMHG
jgi:hypothetical protein